MTNSLPDEWVTWPGLPAMSLRRKALLTVLTAFVALVWNRDFLRPWPLPVMLQMNDVSSILYGYYQTPHLLHDGLRWWHGPWIQHGIYAFRPVSAYLYWGECWAGLHWGFYATAWVGTGCSSSTACWGRRWPGG